MIIQAAITCNDLKIYTQILLKPFAILVTLTSKTTDAMALNFCGHYSGSIKVTV